MTTAQIIIVAILGTLCFIPAYKLTFVEKGKHGEWGLLSMIAVIATISILSLTLYSANQLRDVVSSKCPELKNMPNPCPELEMIREPIYKIKSTHESKSK